MTWELALNAVLSMKCCSNIMVYPFWKTKSTVYFTLQGHIRHDIQGQLIPFFDKPEYTINKCMDNPNLPNLALMATDS